MPDFEPIHVLGLMSGTSGDGVDAALVRTDGESISECRQAITMPYHRTLRERLLHVAQHDVPLSEVMDVEKQMTLVHARACEALLDSHDELLGIRPELIGFHGHTIRHEPAKGFTWQIGDPSLLAEKTACPVVSDFRRRDMAAGGEGAPLAPLFHRELLRDQEKPAAMLNIGGVANITWVGKDGQIFAGDTGPGCGLLDAFVCEHTGKPYDKDGALAQSGAVNNDALARWMSADFFQRQFPKSADRYQFITDGLDSISVTDGAATLTAFTVAAIERSIEFLPQPPKTLVLAGGGANNRFLSASILRRLRERWGCEIGYSSKAASLESECFAWLAVRRLRGLPTSLPETTGCSRPVCGGVLTDYRSSIL